MVFVNTTIATELAVEKGCFIEHMLIVTPAAALALKFAAHDLLGTEFLMLPVLDLYQTGSDQFTATPSYVKISCETTVAEYIHSSKAARICLDPKTTGSIVFRPSVKL